MKPARPVYSQDRNAPRMRKAKYSTNVITNELWRDLKKKYPEYKGKTNAQLNKIWNELAQTIREETVTNPLGVKLGSYTGELKLQYLPYKFEAEDHGMRQKLGETILHTNLVTKGKVAKLKWERRWAVRFNKMLQYFAFSPTREMTDLAKKYIDENPEKVRVARTTGNSKKQ